MSNQLFFTFDVIKLIIYIIISISAIGTIFHVFKIVIPKIANFISYERERFVEVLRFQQDSFERILENQRTDFTDLLKYQREQYDKEISRQQVDWASERIMFQKYFLVLVRIADKFQIKDFETEIKRENLDKKNTEE